MPGAVAEPILKEMFDFVINLGGKKGGFVQRLFEYERRFVDHKKRRLPPQAWASVNALAANLPRTKVALLMRAYSKDPVKGFCPQPETMWQKVPQCQLETLEELLAFFQQTLRSAVADLGTEPAEVLLANVALAATEAWYRTWNDRVKVHKCKSALLQATKEFYDEILAKQQALHRSRGAEGDYCLTAVARRRNWIDFAGVQKEEEQEKEKPIMPVVLQFDADGQPTNAQMETPKGALETILELLVQQWHRSVTVRGLDMERTHQAAIAMVMHQWHQSDSTTAGPLQMQYDVDSGKCIVVAKEHIRECELELLPCCPGARQFPRFSTNPSAVQIKVAQERPTQDPEPCVYYANPEFKLPTIKVAPVAKDDAAVAAPEEQDATAVAVASTADKTYQFNFGGTESIHFFWGLQRMSADDILVKGREKGCESWRFNLTFKEKDYRVIVPGVGGSPTIYRVSMPTIVNTVPLNKGDRLIVEVAKQVKQKNEPSRKVAWQHESKVPKQDRQKKVKVSASSEGFEVL